MPSNLQLLQERANRFLQAKRRYVEPNLSYLIVVPTLRCNLACSYCQVSRADENAKGFDWTVETERRLFELITKHAGKPMKIEFQGGEPLLRVDILRRVRDHCRQHLKNPEFVVCSNLQAVSDDAWKFLSDSDTSVSTSLDGTFKLHREQRTIKHSTHDVFCSNLERALTEMGPDRVSALPTLDMDNLPEPKDVIATFSSLGLRSIFLRPINHMGFARKRHEAIKVSSKWNAYRRQFTNELISYNAKTDRRLEEFYFTHCLRRVFQAGLNKHVDLRNPNPLGHDYLVVDYDGRYYPTDEARMITRSGQLDLSIGDLETGLDTAKLTTLNQHNTNDDDPACADCAYQSYCGVDRIDDISRYGTIEVERLNTEFCRRHMDIFDHIFELIYSEDDNAKTSLAFWLGVPIFDPLLAPVHS